jgi:hypothetical protein
MALSPKYGWAEPDNSSLVKNGAQDIRALGDAIDTSVWNVGYGQAGKNKIINGDFGIWQRGTSFTPSTSTSTYTSDRWQTFVTFTSGTCTISQQTFTLGTAPVAGYESNFFWRIATAAGQTYWENRQRIEDVRTLAGQTVTVSFWAKADSARKVGVFARQNFGSGGSANVDTDMAGSPVQLSSSWTRFSGTITLPSISGKTVGASSYLALTFNQAATETHTSATIDIWGVQVEYGSKATPFQTASGGSPQAELAMCQRYFVRFGLPAVSNSFVGQGGAISTTLADITLTLPVQQRTGATSITYSGLQLSDRAGSPIAVSSVAQLVGDAGQQTVEVTVASGLTQYRNYWMQQTASTSFLAFNAEL